MGPAARLPRDTLSHRRPRRSPGRAPDLILLDLMMPGGVDGLERCRRIRAEPRLKRTKVIMWTALASGADRSAGLAAGANGYLAKPFSPLELMKTIASALG